MVSKAFEWFLHIYLLLLNDLFAIPAEILIITKYQIRSYTLFTFTHLNTENDIQQQNDNVTRGSDYFFPMVRIS